MIRRLWELERIYILVMIFIVLNIITLVYAGVSAHRQLQQAECQTMWNTHFLAITKANASAGAGYQTAVADTLSTMGQILEKPRSDTSRTELASALAEFDRAYAELSAARERYPVLPNPACQ
jgi:hypothetical protein